MKGKESSQVIKAGGEDPDATCRRTSSVGAGAPARTLVEFSLTAGTMTNEDLALWPVEIDVKRREKSQNKQKIPKSESRQRKPQNKRAVSSFPPRGTSGGLGLGAL